MNGKKPITTEQLMDMDSLRYIGEATVTEVNSTPRVATVKSVAERMSMMQGDKAYFFMYDPTTMVVRFEPADDDVSPPELPE